MESNCKAIRSINKSEEKKVPHEQSGKGVWPITCAQPYPNLRRYPPSVHPETPYIPTFPVPRLSALYTYFQGICILSPRCSATRFAARLIFQGVQEMWEKTTRVWKSFLLALPNYQHSTLCIVSTHFLRLWTLILLTSGVSASMWVDHALGSI